jgi:hypothetical protein
MPYTYTDIDPTTGKPLQQSVVAPQTQQVQTQQQQPGQFDIEKFAADSATRQMMFAYSHGMRPTQQDFEDARKAAYQQGFETQRQMQLDTMRQQAELKKSMQMRTFEQFGPREMSAEETKDAGGLMAAHDQIMMLYRQNQDIPENHLYRTTAAGDPAAGVGVATDPRIRLYESTRGGSIIPLGRSLLMDTGQVAGKEEAQTLIKNLMPGPGDSTQMASRKTADMLQMQLNGLKSKIQALPSNVDSTPLRNAYTEAYNDYAQIVNQSGSDSQKNYPALSPQQLFGKDAPQIATVNAPKPAVQSGFTQATTDTLNAQAAGKSPVVNQPVYTDIDPQTKQPLTQAKPTAVGAAAQQAGQYAGGSQVGTPAGLVQPSEQRIAAATTPQQDQPTIFQTVPEAVGKGAQATINWFGGLLPENWPKESLQQ